MKLAVPSPVRSAIVWPCPHTVAKSTFVFPSAWRASARLISTVLAASPWVMPVRMRLDRPPTRTPGQPCPWSRDYRVLFREHLLHARPLVAAPGSFVSHDPHGPIKAWRVGQGHVAADMAVRDRPALRATLGDPADSIPTVSSPTAASTSTVVTCKSPRPTSRSQRIQDVAWVLPQRAATQRGLGRHQGHSEWCVWSPPILRSSTRFTPTPS